MIRYHSLGASSQGGNGGANQQICLSLEESKRPFTFFPQQQELKFWSVENTKRREPVLQLHLYSDSCKLKANPLALSGTTHV